MKTASALLLATLSLAAALTVANNLPTASSTSLSAQESQDLQFMREEEKLAHDVYVALYAKWQSPVFLNISKSEATHSASVKTLLDRYGIVDPAAGKQPGEFTHPELAALYQSLITEGSQSLTAALNVGRKIEELDIKDLDERLAHTRNADIQRVYSNLKRGSQNHLQAFTGGRNR